MSDIIVPPDPEQPEINPEDPWAELERAIQSGAFLHKDVQLNNNDVELNNNEQPAHFLHKRALSEQSTEQLLNNEAVQSTTPSENEVVKTKPIRVSKPWPKRDPNVVLSFITSDLAIKLDRKKLILANKDLKIRRFVRAFCKSNNSIEAATAIGLKGNTAKKGAYTMLSDPYVRFLIRREQEAICLAEDMSAYKIVAMIKKELTRCTDFKATAKLYELLIKVTGADRRFDDSVNGAPRQSIQAVINFHGFVENVDIPQPINEVEFTEPDDDE